MIYLDSSVAIAPVMTEVRRPPAAFWSQEFVSSRLLQFEVWNRLHAHKATRYRHGLARQVLQRVGLLEMTPEVLARALRPLPLNVRTLDGLHLATAAYVVEHRSSPMTIASYDQRMLIAATEMGFSIVEP